jgi:hypothetical protein
MVHAHTPYRIFLYIHSAMILVTVVALYNTTGLTSPALYRKVLSMAEAAALSPPELRRAPRRGLAIYFALVVVISGSLEAYYIINRELLGTLFGLLALMWSPAVVSVIARLVLREGFSDVSFRFGGATHLAVVRAWPGRAPRRRHPRLRRRLADGPGRVPGRRGHLPGVVAEV